MHRRVAELAVLSVSLLVSPISSPPPRPPPRLLPPPPLPCPLESEKETSKRSFRRPRHDLDPKLVVLDSYTLHTTPSKDNEDDIPPPDKGTTHRDSNRFSNTALGKNESKQSSSSTGHVAWAHLSKKIRNFRCTSLSFPWCSVAESPPKKGFPSTRFARAWCRTRGQQRGHARSSYCQ